MAMERDEPQLPRSSLPPPSTSALNEACMIQPHSSPHACASDEQLAQRRQVILSSAIGNLLEWYDFLAYAYFAPVLSSLFFPPTDHTTQLLSAYGVFAAGFIFRPLGAAFFGYIGDKYSRKTALTLSIWVMSIPTFLMGCLPTYHQVGVLAPCLLVLARIVQGFAVGGEFTSSMVFLVEHAEAGSEGFQGSFAFLSVMLGVFVGSTISLLFNWALTDEQLHSWGWRLPFLLSILGAGVGVFIRRNLNEPPRENEEDRSSKEGTEQESLLESGGNDEGKGKSRFRSFSVVWSSEEGLAARGAFCIFMIDFTTAIGFYLTVIFLPVFFQTFLGLTRLQAMCIHELNVIVYGAMTLVGGWLSDRMLKTGGGDGSRLPVIALSSLALSILGWPLWKLITTGKGSTSTPTSVMGPFEGQFLLSIIQGIFAGCLPAAFCQLIKHKFRVTGVSVSHNISMALVGGTAPLIATALIKGTGEITAPGFMLMGAGILTLLGVILSDRLI